MPGFLVIAILASSEGKVQPTRACLESMLNEISLQEEHGCPWWGYTFFSLKTCFPQETPKTETCLFSASDSALPKWIISVSKLTKYIWLLAWEMIWFIVSNIWSRPEMVQMPWVFAGFLSCGRTSLRKSIFRLFSFSFFSNTDSRLTGIKRVLSPYWERTSPFAISFSIVSYIRERGTLEILLSL